MIVIKLFQLPVPEVDLKRVGHTTTSVRVCPGLEEVTIFAGCTSFHVTGNAIAKTAVITLGKHIINCMLLSVIWE